MLLIIETWRLMLRLFLSPVNPILIIQRNDGLVVYFWNLMIFFIILLLIIGHFINVMSGLTLTKNKELSIAASLVIGLLSVLELKINNIKYYFEEDVYL